jgi:hypothetical protein
LGCGERSTLQATVTLVVEAPIERERIPKRVGNNRKTLSLFSNLVPDLGSANIRLSSSHQTNHARWLVYGEYHCSPNSTGLKDSPSYHGQHRTSWPVGVQVRLRSLSPHQLLVVDRLPDDADVPALRLASASAAASASASSLASSISLSQHSWHMPSFQWVTFLSSGPLGPKHFLKSSGHGSGSRKPQQSQPFQR